MNWIEPHPSGVGFFINPPRNRFYRVWRDPSPFIKEFERDEDGDILRDPDTNQPLRPPKITKVPILQGIERRLSPYLDWDVPAGEDVTYILELANTPGGPYMEVDRQTLRTEAVMGYSILRDGTVMDALQVRDAVSLFFSARLAELAREGAVIARKPEWKQKFPMTVAYDFAEPNLPMGAVGTSYGIGQEGCLGFEYTQEEIKLSLTFVAESREERDSITMAVRGLLMELDWFLGDLGCVNTSYGELSEGFQDVAPVMYITELAIATTSFVWHAAKDRIAWRLLPVTWYSDDGSTAIVASSDR